MPTHPARTRVRAAAIALCGIAAIATAAAAAGPATAATSPQSRVQPAASSLPVVVNCSMHTQVRPGSYTLTCADDNNNLDSLHWVAWGSAAAFATGVNTFNDCIPNCLANHLKTFPVLVNLWRTEPLPGNPGERYFSRMTLVYTGSRSYTAGGKTYHLSQTVTYQLSAHGGL